MHVLGQMLTPNARARVLGEATTFGDEWLEQETKGKREHKIILLPTGSQAVPITEPLCQLQSWRSQARVHAETSDCAKLTDIEQGEMKIPGKFLDRLWEALRKFTDIDSKRSEGEIILKDRHLTQLALDICRELQKQVFGPNQALEKLLQLAQMIYNGREYKEENKKQKNNQTKDWSPNNGC